MSAVGGTGVAKSANVMVFRRLDQENGCVTSQSAFGGAIWTIFSAIGEAVLDTLKALMMFLDRDTLEQLPLLLASHIGIFPSELDRQVRVTWLLTIVKDPAQARPYRTRHTKI